MKKTIVHLEREMRMMRDAQKESYHGNIDKAELLQWLCELAEYIKDNEK